MNSTLSRIIKKRLYFAVFLCYNTSMSNLKKIIAQNLVELRKRKKYTQQDLANMLQYSDKSISKWEKGDSLPDIETLYEICNLYNVTLDFLTHEGAYETKKEFIIPNSYARNKLIIVGMIVSLIWFFCILIFTYALIYTNKVFWPIFVWGLPLSFLILLIFNSIWGKRKWKFIILPILFWSILTAIFCQFLYIGQNLWPVFLLGIPPQIVTILWSQMKRS